MSKPTIFFSHSSMDRKVLSRLKSLFVDKTGGAIDVFLSSDGQSIRFGSNWVSRIEEALEEATLLVVFLTPTALESNWVFFEAGFAYAKGKRVIPVGLLGFDIMRLNPPLSLLQGFNIGNKDGLNNLIKIANDSFTHTHQQSFTEEEFESVIVMSPWARSSLFGEFGFLVERLQIELTAEDGLNRGLQDFLESMSIRLRDANIENRIDQNELEAPGLHAYVPGGTYPERVRIVVDPLTLENSWNVIRASIREARSDGMTGTELYIALGPSVEMVHGAHKISARLLGAGVSFGDGESLRYRELEFSFSNFVQFIDSRPERGSGYIRVKWTSDSALLESVSELITTLFERRVLSMGHESIDGEHFN